MVLRCGLQVMQLYVRDVVFTPEKLHVACVLSFPRRYVRLLVGYN
jgi:hypothetical protein